MFFHRCRSFGPGLHLVHPVQVGPPLLSTFSVALHTVRMLCAKFSVSGAGRTRVPIKVDVGLWWLATQSTAFEIHNIFVRNPQKCYGGYVRMTGTALPERPSSGDPILGSFPQYVDVIRG